MDTKGNYKGYKGYKFFNAFFAIVLSIMMCLTSVAPAVRVYAEDEGDAAQAVQTVTAEDVAAQDEEAQGDETPASFDVPAAQEETNSDEAVSAAEEDKESAEDTDTNSDTNEENEAAGAAVVVNSSDDDESTNPAAATDEVDESTEDSEEDASEDAAEDTVTDGAAAIGNVQYKTLQEAIDVAEDGATVIITKDIELDQTVVIDGKNITVSDDGIARVISSKDSAVCPLFIVKTGAELTLDGTSVESLKLKAGNAGRSVNATALQCEGTLNIKKVTIDGGNINNGYLIGAINATNSGRIYMHDGILENTSIDSSTKCAAAIYISAGSHLEMMGGTIRNNKNAEESTASGGGVLLMSWNASEPLATMNMSGGSISGNEAQFGGGVYMTGRSKFHMTGGSIDSNRARRDGGGVCVSGKSASGWYDVNEFVMDGGSISNNRATNGAGIYVNSDAVYLNAGYIERNVTTKKLNDDYTGHGGGVYVSVVPRVLHINNAVITENNAVPINFAGGTSGMGGGLWACPTGSINLKVTNGVAVYGNSASGNGAAGDDVVNVYYYGVNKKGTTTLADRMLGGGRVEWYRDGGIKDNIVGYVDTSVPRFDPEDPGEPISFSKGIKASIAVKAVTTESAIKRANEEATLFIRYNTANHGGGIGTNGDLALKSYDYTDWKLKAEKKWEGIEEADQKDVKVFLKIDDEILDSVMLSKDNDWTAEFTELPDPDSLATKIVTVVEGEMVENEDGTSVFKETDEYTVDYERTVSEEDQTIYVTVTNSPLKELRITKVWAEDVAEEDIPDEITVNLKLDDHVIETIVVKKEADWQARFRGLNKEYLEAGRYSIEEVQMDKFVAVIEDIHRAAAEDKKDAAESEEIGVIKEDTEHIWEASITNSYRPPEEEEPPKDEEEPPKDEEPPVDEEEPPKEEEEVPPTVEEEYEPPAGDEEEVQGVYTPKREETEVKSVTEVKTKSIETGDYTDITTAVLALTLALAAIAALLIRRKRAQR